MKALYSIFIVILIAMVLGCQREIDHSFSGGGNNNNNPNNSFKATLQGNIIDENGEPAIGVKVQIAGTSATSDTRGYFRIANATLNKNATMISAEKDGYFKAFRTFSATTGVNQVEIKLIRKKLAGRISTGSGGTVTLSNGTGITLPANGVVKESGAQTYSGDINVYSSYIDPTAADIASILPGSFLAQDKDNKEVILTSYGMLAVELESTSGEKLQIASGKTAVLLMPIPASIQSTAPSTISLWYVDEQTGIWKEEGSAVKEGANYKGEVKHFSYWNCDVAGPTVTLTATFKIPHGMPFVHGEVYVRSSNGQAGAAHGFTDSLGQIANPVPANTPLVIQIVDPCGNVIYSQNAGPFSAAANLGTITLPPSTLSSVVTVKGKLLDCGNNPVTNGYAVIYYNNTVRYATAKSSGEFEINFATCPSSPIKCEILGVDKTTQQQSAAVSVFLTSSVTDAGNIKACGAAATEYQFINYTYDGVGYSITSDQSDSLYAYQMGTTPPFNIEMAGAGSTTKYINFRFSNNGATGTFPISSLNVNSNDANTLISPFNVTLTNYPTMPGQFYEGTFTGQFTYVLSPTPVHTISGSFRLRRSQ